MNFLFKKKPNLKPAEAICLQDGRELATQWSLKNRHNGPFKKEPTFEILVRVETQEDGAFESQMVFPLSLHFVLVSGVRVRVEYDPLNHSKVTSADTNQAILDRNPQIIKQA